MYDKLFIIEINLNLKRYWFMEEQKKQFVDLKKIEGIQIAFEDSMKLIEKSIAESITNNQKLKVMKEDMLAANKKFHEAEECLESLKIKLKNFK